MRHTKYKKGDDMGDKSMKILGVAYVSGLFLSIGIDPEGLVYASVANTVLELSTYLIEISIILIVVAKYTTILTPIINSKSIGIISLCVMLFGILAGLITLGNSLYGLAFLVIGGICARVGP